MSVTHGTVRTEHASRYLQQLCKHWSHKLPVDFDPRKGVITFEHARVLFVANEGKLSIEIEAPRSGEAERMQGVVVRHIERFAFREHLAFNWTPPS